MTLVEFAMGAIAVAAGSAVGTLELHRDGRPRFGVVLSAIALLSVGMVLLIAGGT